MQKAVKILCFILNCFMILLASGILGLGLYGIRQGDISLAEERSTAAEISSIEAIPSPSSTALVSPEPVNTDPAYYQQLSETAIAQENFGDAASVLEEGIAATGSEELALQLEALELTIQLPDYQKTLLDGLYTALASGDQEQVEAAITAWASAYTNTIVLTETPWTSTYRLSFIWDGTRFLPHFTGVGLAFSEDSLYYGQLQDGIPNGSGTMITNFDYFRAGEEEYLRLDGTWQMGTVVGEGVYHYQNIDGDLWDATCVFDETEAEVMTTATFVYSYQDWSGTLHQTTLQVEDGYLSPYGMEAWDGWYRSPCSIHSGCGCGIWLDYSAEHEGPALCKNPQPWGRESPYEWVSLSPMLYFFSYG